MTLDELNIKLFNRFFNKKDTLLLELLLGVINDWPIQANSLNDFLEQIKSDLKVDIITIEDINKALNKMSACSEAWKMEAYSGLIDIMVKNNYSSLNELIFHCETGVQTL